MNWEEAMARARVMAREVRPVFVFGRKRYGRWTYHVAAGTFVVGYNRRIPARER